ncbi:hypothetical protein [Oligosphaera ethanolica]|uniref:SIR2-like domain-containing protein n=1 Tax=Oligosphaera ethanolica TaxID=760260 RepID=A0AAE3VHH9_9BACT|nr:hypothetical protein [Oligosphaera ethanolica]MDQ0290549.1 hypothetical protein [Oligosphaera ethanolica]
MNHQDSDWRSLLLRPIKNGKMVPIVGQELLTYCGEDGRVVPLRGVLAKKLARKHGLDESAFTEQSTLCDVAYQLDPSVRKDDTFYDEVRDIYEDINPPVPPVLRQLAKIGFRAFLTTTWEPLLCQAIAEERYKGDQSPIVVRKLRLFDNGRDGVVEDIPWQQIPDGVTLVYHLFGNLKESGRDYALTEEDMLRCAARYIECRHDYLTNFVSFLEGVKLLTLGCSLPNWFARFFVCLLKGDKIEQTVQLADERSRTDPDLCAFMSRGGNHIYDSDALEFTRRLYERWDMWNVPLAAENDNSTLPPFRPGAIFISYSKQGEKDRQAASALFDALQKLGANVWMDVIPICIQDDCNYIIHC